MMSIMAWVEFNEVHLMLNVRWDLIDDVLMWKSCFGCRISSVDSLKDIEVEIFRNKLGGSGFEAKNPIVFGTCCNFLNPKMTDGSKIYPSLLLKIKFNLKFPTKKFPFNFPTKNLPIPREIHINTNQLKHQTRWQSTTIWSSPHKLSYMQIKIIQ